MQPAIVDPGHFQTWLRRWRTYTNQNHRWGALFIVLSRPSPKGLRQVVPDQAAKDLMPIAEMAKEVGVILQLCL